VLGSGRVPDLSLRLGPRGEDVGEMSGLDVRREVGDEEGRGEGGEGGLMRWPAGSMRHEHHEGRRCCCGSMTEMAGQ
jgi:hypothetical protein